MSKALFTDFEAGTPGRVGYARASTVGQSDSLQRQVRHLGNEGACRRVYWEVVSGAARERPALAALRQHVRPGDVIVVESLDRLGRKAAELLELCEAFLAGGMAVEAMREGISTGGHAGRMILPFVAALAEAERVNLKERTRIGVDEARRKGRIVGRPRLATPERARAAAALRAEGRSLLEIAKALRVSKSTVKRMLDGLDGATRAGAQVSLPLSGGG